MTATMRASKEHAYEPHPLAHHSEYWRRVAAEERANGWIGLAEDYDLLADHADRICRELCPTRCWERAS